MKKIANWYNYLFYSIYRLYYNGKEDDYAGEYTRPVNILSVLVSLNILAIFKILSLFIQIDSNFKDFFPGIIISSVLFIMLIISQIWFSYKKRYQKIYLFYKNNNELKRFKLMVSWMVLFIPSYILFILLFFYPF